MDIDESHDAAVRVPAGDDGEDGEQQHVRQLVHLPLPPGVDRALRSTTPAAVRTLSRQPPRRLPSQESDICRSENPVFDPSLRFIAPVLQARLRSRREAALNSLDAPPPRTCLKTFN